MNRSFLRSVLISIIVVFLLTACEKNIISKININFNSINEIRIMTMEQAERSDATERYEISDKDRVTYFLEILGSAQRVDKAETPFALGDGVITLVSNGSNQYTFRYYKDKNQLLDLHKGVLYQFPDGLEEILSNLDSLSKVNIFNN